MSAKRESGGMPERTRRCMGIARPTLVPRKSHWNIFIPGRRGWVSCPESEDLPYVNNICLRGFGHYFITQKYNLLFKEKTNEQKEQKD